MLSIHRIYALFQSFVGPRAATHFVCPTNIGTSAVPQDRCVEPKNVEHFGDPALGVSPARLNVQQAAAFLGFEPHEIHILAGAGVSKPFGQKPRNAPRYFALVRLKRLQQDEAWLDTATEAVQAYWRRQNQRKRRVSSSRSRIESPRSSDPAT